MELLILFAILGGIYLYKNPNILNPKSFKKGEAFEKFTRDEIFTNEEYHIVSKSHDYNQNSKDFVLDSLNPDFKFRNKETNSEFWIECKFRSYSNSKKIEIISKNQLERHKKIKEPCFVFLGIGENPNTPTHLFLIPIEKCYSKMYWNYLYKFKY